MFLLSREEGMGTEGGIIMKKYNQNKSGIKEYKKRKKQK